MAGVSRYLIAVVKWLRSHHHRRYRCHHPSNWADHRLQHHCKLIIPKRFSLIDCRCDSIIVSLLYKFSVISAWFVGRFTIYGPRLYKMHWFSWDFSSSLESCAWMNPYFQRFCVICSIPTNINAWIEYFFVREMEGIHFELRMRNVHMMYTICFDSTESTFIGWPIFVRGWIDFFVISNVFRFRFGSVK